MKTQTWIFGASVVVLLIAIALVAFSVLSPFALAQGPLNGPEFRQGNGPMMGRDFGFRSGMGPRFGDGFRAGMGNGWGGPKNSLVAVAAEQLGLTRPELVAELQTGKTIAEVAAEHEVAVDTIVQAFLAPRAERLAELVADGQLTQEQADTILATMEAKATEHISEPWSPQGHGRGMGFIDSDGDGVCDFAGNGGRGRGQGGQSQ